MSASVTLWLAGRWYPACCLVVSGVVVASEFPRASSDFASAIRMAGAALFGLGAVFLLVHSRAGYTVQAAAVLFPLSAFLPQAFPDIRNAVERHDTFGALWIGFITAAVTVGALSFAYALVRLRLRSTPNV